jgi:hypothetical protein
MKRVFIRAVCAPFFFVMMCALPCFPQAYGGDPLNESPLSAVPKEMTFEEYRDMNRRLNVGLVVASVPIPGMIHFYAGEKKTGYIVLGTAAGALGLAVAGIAAGEGGDFPKSDFDLLVLNEGDKKRERRFEKIPVQINGPDTVYNLKELGREGTGVGMALLLTGIAVFIGDIVFDFVHGVHVVEKKRDTVRFKYGRALHASAVPVFNIKDRSAGAGLALEF